MLLATILTASNAIIIDCSYSQFSVGVSCQATINTVGNTDAITAVTDSTGSADPTLQASEIKYFTLLNGGNQSRIDHLPPNLATFFPYLISLQWCNAYLKTISHTDLEPYPNLVLLQVGVNKIRKLHGNLFQGNRQLQYIDLGYNRIDEIGRGLFDGLNNIKSIILYGNKCVVYPSSQLGIGPLYNTAAEVIRSLYFLCGTPETPEASGPCSSDPCLASCKSNADALQIRVNAVTENVNAPWYHKMRLFFKALFFW